MTDAGTPGIADPGARLVEAARRGNVRVVPVPGPSAVATALSISGFSADEFAFMGLPPRSGKERENWLRRLNSDPRVVVFFEAPHRIERTLADVKTLKGKRPIVVCREITKIHEQLVTIVQESLDQRQITKGEFTIVVGPWNLVGEQPMKPVDIVDIFGRLNELAGLPEGMALEIIDETFNVSPSEVRKALKRHRISVKQQNREPA